MQVSNRKADILEAPLTVKFGVGRGAAGAVAVIHSIAFPAMSSDAVKAELDPRVPKTLYPHLEQLFVKSEQDTML